MYTEAALCGEGWELLLAKHTGGGGGAIYDAAYHMGTGAGGMGDNEPHLYYTFISKVSKPG